MADVLLTSLSALLSSQRALATTGHNIANVNTPGYSRQRVDLGTRLADFTGSGAVGNGVQVTNVRRSYDVYLAGATRGNQSEFSRLNVFHSLASKIDGLLANESAGLAPSMQAFFSAAQDVANDPSSIPARQAFLSQADGIADRFQSLAGQFQDIESEVSSRMRQEVEDIDGLANSISTINQEIITATGRSNGPPNDLLDARDRLIDELSTKVDVTTTPQEDGALNVFVGNGQSLVVGTQAANLSVQSDPFNPSRLNVMLQNGGSRTDISSAVSGGSLGGTMDFRREVLDPARNEIGRIAVAFAATVNAQQASGMDLNGDLGGQFFSVAEPKVINRSGNAGSGAVAATITDVSALTSADYELSFSGGAYSLSRTDTGESVPMTGSGTAGDPFVADGVSFVTSGTPSDGDAFLIRPTYDAAASLQNVLGSPQEIAAAGPLRSSADLNNTGSGVISGGMVVDADDPQLLSSSVIEFTSPTTYSINGSGSFPYTADEPINLNGATFQISGTPEAGDTFTIEPNTGGQGDNANMLAMANLQGFGVLDGGSSTLGSTVSQLVAEVGSSTRQAGTNLTAQSVLLEQSLTQQQSVSGVNLDEEAANMLRYQQAYEAAAQMITVADSMFASLLNAVGR